jgi:hypothetical protein
VPYKGSVLNVITQLIGGLASSMGYTGCHTIEQMRTQTQFVRVSAAGMRESHVHDVQITKEAPNYRIRQLTPRLHGPSKHPFRSHPDPGLRLSVHTAHCAAGARGGRLLRVAPLGYGGNGHPGLRAERRDPLRRTAVGARRRDPAGRCGGVRTRRAGARHLLRHADHVRAARRECGAGDRARIRLRPGARPRPLAPAARHRGPHQP